MKFFTLKDDKLQHPAQLDSSKLLPYLIINCRVRVARIISRLQNSGERLTSRLPSLTGILSLFWEALILDILAHNGNRRSATAPGIVTRITMSR
jgi:hypothetical protein